MQFLKSNIEDEWMDLCEEFPEFIFELSPYVEEWYDNYSAQCQMSDKSELCNLRYGFECGIGWKTIIREYFTQIRDLIKKARSFGHDIHYKACIMKEKFGSLRDQGDFYGRDYNIYYKQYYDLSNVVEVVSTNTCEICGDIGKIRKGSWVKTLCDKHCEEKA